MTATLLETLNNELTEVLKLPREAQEIFVSLANQEIIALISNAKFFTAGVKCQDGLVEMKTEQQASILRGRDEVENGLSNTLIQGINPLKYRSSQQIDNDYASEKRMIEFDQLSNSELDKIVQKKKKWYTLYLKDNKKKNETTIY
eukprot:TRINITY_DN16224_c0_g1_i2.p1 TRINITY_DN16224_c0_g1~~TRINITY_DN16224_c0_g1_i2.p1  ORF type:complete len:158 (-),score=14.28 TRINITY_DN16224_c0_g1_i2:345-779(-)